VHNLATDRENPLEGHNYCYAWWEAMKPAYEGTPVRAAYDRVERPPVFELFNLRSDPYLIANLADNPEHRQRVDRMARRIEAWRGQTGDPFLDPAYGEAYAQEVGRLKTEWEIRQGIRKAPAKAPDRKKR